MAALRGARALWGRVRGSASACRGRPGGSPGVRARAGACLGAGAVAAAGALYFWYHRGARGATEQQHSGGLSLLPALRARGHDKEGEEEEEEARPFDLGDRDVSMSSHEYRFHLFSSVEYEGQLYMTPQNFIESVTMSQPRNKKPWRSLTKQELEKILADTPPVWKGTSKLFRNLRERGIIAYTEYLFLLCILTKPHAGFKIAFNMFDADGNQMVDKREFLVVKSVNTPVPRYFMEAGPLGSLCLDLQLGGELHLHVEPEICIQISIDTHHLKPSCTQKEVRECGGVGKGGGLMEDTTARWMLVLGQSDTKIRPVPAYLTCAVERGTRIIGMPHHVEPTHQVSLLSVDSFWVQLQEIFRKKNEKRGRKGDTEKSAQLSMQLYGYQVAPVNSAMKKESQEEVVARSYWDMLRRGASQALFSDLAELPKIFTALLLCLVPSPFFALSDQSQRTDDSVMIDTTLLVHFFGKKGKAELTFDDFYRFMDNLQTEVLEIEFLTYSKGMTTISEEDFARILLRYTNVEDIRSYLENVRQSIPDEKVLLLSCLVLSVFMQGITFDEFRSFFQFLNNLEDFAIAMQMYNFASRSIGQDEFARAVYVATGLNLTRHLVNTIFKIFDVDHDDQLSYKEFIGIMKDRLHRGARVRERERERERMKEGTPTGPPQSRHSYLAGPPCRWTVRDDSSSAAAQCSVGPPLVLHQWAQDTAHRTLPHRTLPPQDAAPQDAAPQDAAHRTLPHRTLPTGHCPKGRCPQDVAPQDADLQDADPQDAACITLPTGRRPQDTSHRTLPTGRCPTGRCPTGRCPQDAAHRMLTHRTLPHRTLPTGRCLHNAAHRTLPHRTLPTGCCLHNAAHRTLPTGRCPTGRCPQDADPQDAAHRMLPSGHCPQNAAHRTLPHRRLPTGHCPQDAAPQEAAPQEAAHRTLPTGRRPQDTAHRTPPTGRCWLDSFGWWTILSPAATLRCPAALLCLFHSHQHHTH
ncbi:hypothetical protein NFI96_031691 [Prochilodus magdalenae]|nr:hypothetical protein NFI96_031691 [Prochilodus magdalenae]